MDGSIYNNVETSIDDLNIKFDNQYNAVIGKLNNIYSDINKNKFSIDALLKSISNYIKNERDFNDWYYSQSIWRILWWRIKKYNITYIRNNFYNKK